MIRIARPDQAPDVLLDAGKQKTSLNCKSYDLDPEAYRSRETRFQFERSVYADRSVKDLLLRAQHDKCCFCESKFPATSPGAIEHFRPKGGVKQESGKPMLFPGYYWLAYSWTNLLVSCETCNTSYKGSLFPLADEEKRARSHRDDIDAETPIFIDPAIEDPRQHIRFRGAEVEHLTERGLRTIQGLGLGRGKLEDARAEVLEPLDILCSVIEDLKDQVQSPKVERARRLLQKAIRPEAMYTAMVQDLLDKHASGFEAG